MLISLKKFDPSENRQHFENMVLKIHCCRYWQLSEWECNNMAFPFWRLYHNTIEGARISFGGNITYLTVDKLVIIPPNTSYSNALHTDSQNGIIREGITGKKITNDDLTEEIKMHKMVDHLFVHFNLGIPHDFVKPGVYSLPVLPDFQNTLQTIKRACILNTITRMPFVMELHSLITKSVASLPANIWYNINIDKRMFRIIQYIEHNLNTRLNNKDMAHIANMAINSFARLFRQTMGESVQHYIIRRKIEKARLLLHHSDNSIDEIAFECGFCDRYHFSKTFKHIVSMTPVSYKKMHAY